MELFGDFLSSMHKIGITATFGQLEDILIFFSESLSRNSKFLASLEELELFSSDTKRLLPSDRALSRHLLKHSLVKTHLPIEYSSITRVFA